ncbi:MAG: hypothetical protein CMN76_00030 [Spirochaetaceae bacterium]|nr:hypothetical protein [Spirochaetaceae bacterium]
MIPRRQKAPSKASPARDRRWKTSRLHQTRSARIIRAMLYRFLAFAILGLAVLQSSCKEDDLTEMLLPGVTSPPRILAAYPPDGTQGLDRSEGIWVVFDQPMDERQSERAFTLTGPSGRIQGAFTWQNGTRLEFKPSQQLDDAGQYFIRVAASAESIAGIDLESDYRARFSLSADTEGPSIVSTTPADAEQGVAVDSDIQVTFSEAVDFASLQNGISLSPSVSFVTSLSGDGRTVTIQPSSNLVVGLRYSLSITEDVQDLEGNPLSNPDVISFFTGTDFEAPEILAVTVGGQALTAGITTNGIDKNGPIVIQFSEPMAALLTEDNVDLSPSASYSISWNLAGDTLTLDLDGLESEANYEISVTSGAEDLAGNQLSNPGDYPFFTDAANSTRPTVVSVEQVEVDVPNGADGASATTVYNALNIDYSIVDISQTADMDPAPASIEEALVFRVLFDKDMQLTSLYEALSFVPVIDTGGSSLSVHSIQFGSAQNEVFIYASWTPAGASSSPVYALQFSTQASDTDDNTLEEQFRRYLSF